MTKKPYTFEDYLKETCEKDPKFKKLWEDGQEARVLGSALVGARINTGMTQRDLMDKTGIDQGQICRIECGEANPSFRTLRRLAAGLGMKVKIEFVPDLEGR